MDVPAFEKKWDSYYKEIKGAVPVEKELLAEVGGVQGALGQLKTVKASADKAGAELKKALILVASAANAASKEAAGVAAAAKKAGKAIPGPLGPDTEKDLKILIKNASTLRDALGKYESQAD